MTDKSEEIECKLCGAKCRRIYDLYDDRYGYPGLFLLLQCSSCGHRFLHCSMSPEQLADLYTNYYPRSSFRVEDYKPHEEIGRFSAWLAGAYRSAFRWVPRNVRVLDIGCGFGETLGYHKARGNDVYGVEADGNIGRIAEKYGFKVHIGLFDPEIYEPAFFDYVTMDQVIEHVTDPLSTMKGIAKVLKPGGKAIISTPNANGWGAKVFGRRWINWHAPYHLQHFSITSMKTAAGQAGLSLERCVTITPSDWLYWQWLHLVTFPELGEPSSFWSSMGKRLPMQTGAFYLLSIIHLTKINHFITRLFDILKLGDNMLFFLSKPMSSQ